jgi:N-acetylmuramoyl-L-alanine amidase
VKSRARGSGLLRVTRAAVLLGALAMLADLPAASAQTPRSLSVIRSGGTPWTVRLATARGFAAVDLRVLDSLGWKVGSLEGHALLDGPGGSHVDLRADNPFFRWDDTIFQLADTPYLDGGRLFVPLQLLSDYLPDRLPDTYAFDADSMALRWKDAAGVPGARPVTLMPVDSTRVVIIDPGHGGVDPGTSSRSGIQEKTVALAIAKDLAAALRGVPGLEVHLTRTTDTLVALWDRGQIATRLKGDRPGIFISIHCNSTTTDRAHIRGFETYVLSEARTEHERRVAAIENAPLGVDTTSGKAGSDLDYILRDMKNLDTQHWSSLLAQMVQDEMAKVDSSPDRGVKQAPLAVITNALMPAVLVEVGYLSNPQEARLLAQKPFQEKTARAIARAIEDFFARYPPRSGDAGGGGGEGR